MTIVLKNSAKIKPRQHILAVPLVTSPGIIRSEAEVEANESSSIDVTLSLYE